MIKTKNYLILLLLFFNSYNITAKNKKNDILALLMNKPKELELVRFKVIPDYSQEVLEAEYRVPGNKAYKIERILHKKYGMAKIKHVCCIWETHPDGVIPATPQFNKRYKKYYKKAYIKVAMGAYETPIRRRKNWHKIPYFYVLVTVYDESRI
ncbi:MAG: DUF4952 domain-containing protein [Spirochaetota bacterium]